MTTRWTCPTCRVELETPYCAQCGEKAPAPEELQLRKQAGKLFHALTSIDGELLRTFGRLLRAPGALTAAYLAGDRKPYLGPFKLFIVANVLFFAVQSITGTNIFGTPLDSHLHHQDWSPIAQTLVERHLRTAGTTLADYAPVFDRAVILYAKSLIILMVLPFAAVVALLFASARKPFVAHIVYATHLYTFLLLLFSIAVLVAAAQGALGGRGLDDPRLDLALSVVNLAACAVYAGASAAVAYGVRGASLWIRAALAAITAAALVLGYRFAIFVITLALT